MVAVKTVEQFDRGYASVVPTGHILVLRAWPSSRTFRMSCSWARLASHKMRFITAVRLSSNVH
jgi:hypothetical protein